MKLWFESRSRIYSQPKFIPDVSWGWKRPKIGWEKDESHSWSLCRLSLNVSLTWVKPIFVLWLACLADLEDYYYLCAVLMPRCAEHYDVFNVFFIWMAACVIIFRVLNPFRLFSVPSFYHVSHENSSPHHHHNNLHFIAFHIHWSFISLFTTFYNILFLRSEYQLEFEIDWILIVVMDFSGTPFEWFRFFRTFETS